MINFNRSSFLLSTTALVFTLTLTSPELHAGREEKLVAYPRTVEGNDQLMIDAIQTHSPESIQEVFERYKETKAGKAEFLSSPEQRQAFANDLATQAIQYQKLCATDQGLYSKTAELYMWAIEFGHKQANENLSQFLSQILSVKAYKANQMYKDTLQTCESYAERLSNPDLYYVIGQQYEALGSLIKDAFNEDNTSGFYLKAAQAYYKAHTLKHEKGSQAFYALPHRIGEKYKALIAIKRFFEGVGRKGDVRALMALASAPLLNFDDAAHIYQNIMSSPTSTPEEKDAARQAFYGLGQRLMTENGYSDFGWKYLKPIYLKAAETDPYVYVVICSLFENQSFFMEEKSWVEKYYKAVVSSQGLTLVQKEMARKSFYKLSQNLSEWKRERAVPVYTSLITLDDCPEFHMALAQCYTGDHEKENYGKAAEHYLKAEAAYLKAGEVGAAGAKEAKEKFYSLVQCINDLINRKLPSKRWEKECKLRENREKAQKLFEGLRPLYEAEAMKEDARLCKMMAAEFMRGEIVSVDLGEALKYFIKLARLENKSPDTYHAEVLGALKNLSDDDARIQFKKLEETYNGLEEAYAGEKHMLLADLYLPAVGVASRGENPLLAVQLYQEAMHNNVPGAREALFNVINRLHRFPSLSYFMTCVEPLILEEARKVGDMSIPGKLAKIYEECTREGCGKGLVRAAHLYADAESLPQEERTGRVKAHLIRLMGRASTLNSTERAAFSEGFHQVCGVVVNGQDKDSCYGEAQFCEWEGNLVKAITYYLKAARLGKNEAVSKVWDLYSRNSKEIVARHEAIEAEFEVENPYAAALLARLSVNDPKRQLDYDVKAARWGHPDGLEPAEKLYAEKSKNGLTNQTRPIFVPLLSYYVELRERGDTTLDFKIAAMHMDGIHADPEKAGEEKSAAVEIYGRELSRLISLAEAGNEEQVSKLDEVVDVLRKAKLTPQQRVTLLDPFFNFHLAKAKMGDQGSQYSVAVLYKEGFGVERNLSLAAEWYFKAGKNKEAYEVYTSTKGEEDTEVKAKLYSLYLPKAESGDKLAQKTVGKMLKRGDGVARNLAAAAEWYFKGKKPLSAYKLYKVSKGENNTEAMKGLYPQYLVQANGGSVAAQALIGKMLQRGHGVDINMDEAETWFGEVKETDPALGLHRLGRFYEAKGEPEKAFAMFKEAKSSENVKKYVKIDKRHSKEYERDEEGRQVSYKHKDLRSTFLSDQRTYKGTAVDQPSVAVPSSGEPQIAELSKLKQALSSLSAVDPASFENSNVGLLMLGMTVMKPIPGFLEKFEILGKSYVSVGKDNCALSRQIQTALTQSVYEEALKPEIEGKEKTLKSLRKRKSLQEALAEVGDDKAKSKLRYTTLALDQVEKDVERLKTYGTAVNSLERFVSKKALKRRKEFLADDEYGFIW